MATNIGRNRNTNDVATVNTYTINDSIATVIAVVNIDRIYFSACLEPGTTDIDVAIRLYSATTDNIVKGEILTRRTMGNDASFRPNWTMMVDNVYTGEISAICDTGSVVINVTEY